MSKVKVTKKAVKELESRELEHIVETSISAIVFLYALPYISTAAIAIAVAIAAKSVFWPLVIMIVGYKLIN